MIPPCVKTVLWSYDTDKMDPVKDKKTIILQVLNYGTDDAISWLFKTYRKEEIGIIASTIPATAWNKKSLALWTLVLGIKPSLKRLLI